MEWATGPSQERYSVSDHTMKEKLSALQSAIEKQGGQESDSRVDQDRHVSQLQDALDALVAFVTARNAASAKVSETVQSEYRSVADALRGFDPDTMAKLGRELTKSQGALAVANDRIADLERSVEAKAQEARDDIKTARSELKQAKVELDGERSRADTAEAKLKAGGGDGKPSALAAQLAESLKEREAISDQCSALQQEVAGLQRKVADLQPVSESAGEPAAAVQSHEEYRIRMAASSSAQSVPRRVGDILVEAQIITDVQLRKALDVQKKNPKKRLGNVLLELGYALEEPIAQTIASQLKLDFVHLDESNVSEDATRTINGRLAEQHQCIPVKSTGDKLVLAMTNPFDLVAIEDVEKVTECAVEPVVATETDIRNSIQHFYGL